MSKLVIRPGTFDDIPVIMSITQEAFQKYAHDLEHPQKVKALDEQKQDVESDLRQKHVLVAELDGKPVGSVRYEFLPSKIVYFSRFGVKLVAQSCGVGGALVKAVLNASQENAMLAVALHTSARMFSLIRFYYGKGFFIHSTSTDRGYIRALLIKELSAQPDLIDYRKLIPETY